ncbi:MAG: SsrA-binding protein SmpB [Verrucomicrobia bacterium]|nr:SsrA-binding protein SmpB [Verrucomicrobiota bacterium]
MPSPEIATNRKALRDYHILDRWEAGIALKGTEVKSIRLGHANINDAFARIDHTGVPVLYQADIQPYDKASHEQHVPRRERKLLLNAKEIEKLKAMSDVEGRTLVALRMYWKGSRVKVEIGVGKGKEAPDKRADLKAKAIDRETEREIARFRKKRGV